VTDYGISYTLVEKIPLKRIVQKKAKPFYRAFERTGAHHGRGNGCIGGVF
jgi:hypothetical protein